MKGTKAQVTGETSTFIKWLSETFDKEFLKTAIKIIIAYHNGFKKILQ